MHKIEDNVILVTGGAAGIGAQIVRQFLSAGAKYVATLDIDPTAGKALEKELKKEYGQDRFNFIKCDITKEELTTAFEEVVKKIGYIDVIVNNAGVFNDNPSKFVTEIEVNLISLIRITMKAYTLMRMDKGGRGGTVINISSIAAISHLSLFPIYSATKSAVLQFTTCLGMEPHYSRSGVRLVTVCFGYTKTNMTPGGGKHIDEETDMDVPDFVERGNLSIQSAESAALGVVAAFQYGTSASTWLVTSDRPAEDITSNVKKAYKIMEQGAEPAASIPTTRTFTREPDSSRSRQTFHVALSTL